MSATLVVLDGHYHLHLGACKRVSLFIRQAGISLCRANSDQFRFQALKFWAEHTKPPLKLSHVGQIRTLPEYRINRNPLDNRPGRQGKTLPRGVYYSKNGKKFKALSLVNGRLTYHGSFTSVEEASAVATA